MPTNFLLPFLITGFLFFGGEFEALDRLDIKKAFRARKFKVVLGMYNKYPSLFSSGESLYFLAFSLAKLGNLSDGVAACARAAIEMKDRPCYKFLQNMRQKDLGSYRLGLAKHHFESGDLKKAFNYFYHQIQKKPTSQLPRIYLVRILSALQQKDFVVEQLQEVHGNPESLHPIKAGLEQELKQLRHSVSRIQPPFSEEMERGFYLYALTNDKPRLEILSYLHALYRGALSTSDGSLRVKLKLGNILLIQGEIALLKDGLKELDSANLQPLYSLSLASLKRRLAKAIGKQTSLSFAKTLEEGKIWVPSKDKELKLNSAPKLDPVGLETSVSASQKHDLRALDLGELKLATPDDLSPIQRLVKIIKERLSRPLNDYEKRWMLKEMDQADSELMKHENSSQARELYGRSPEGREIRKEFEKLQSQFEVEDRKNSAQFKGEYESFRQAMSSSLPRRKRKVFMRFMERWWRLSQGDGVSLVTQGAMNAYRKTKEGQKLAREVYKMGLELKLKPPGLEMDESFFQDRGF